MDGVIVVLSKAKLFMLLTLTGFPEKDHEALVCIAQEESSLRPYVVNNKSGDYGLFQINYRWWGEACGVKQPGELLDITKNLECARLVYEKQGLTAWVQYNKICKKLDTEVNNNEEESGQVKRINESTR